MVVSVAEILLVDMDINSLIFFKKIFIHQLVLITKPLLHNKTA